MCDNSVRGLFYGIFDLAHKFMIWNSDIYSLPPPTCQPPPGPRATLRLMVDVDAARTPLLRGLRQHVPAPRIMMTTRGHEVTRTRWRGHRDTYMTSEWLLVIIRHRDLVRDNSARRSAEIVRRTSYSGHALKTSVNFTLSIITVMMSNIFASCCLVIRDECY